MAGQERGTGFRARLQNASGEAYKQRTLAEAVRDAVMHNTEGDAFAQRAIATAEADAINVRAAALSGENQALIAANKLVDMLPALVEAAAGGISGPNLTVLNGSQGVNEMAVGVVAQGLSIFETLRMSLATGNGSLRAVDPVQGGSAGDDDPDHQRV